MGTIADGCGRVLFDDARFATSFFPRLKGLLGKKAVPEGFALVFPNCRSVHCMGMSTAIDIAYLDAEGRVIECETVRPWGRCSNPARTRTVIECAAGSFERIGVVVGSPLSLNP